MLEKLKKLLADKEAKRNEMAQRAKTTEDIKELRGINTELEAVNSEIAELRSMIESLPKEPEGQAARTTVVNSDGLLGGEQRGFNPVVGINTDLQHRSNECEDIHGSMEYRNAFKDYIVKGTPIPDKFIQKRSDQLTTVGDVGAVIPTTIQNKVIEDMTVEGKILSRITQTAFQGGVQIPVSDINLTATWLDSENVVSDEQKAAMNAKISFGYHVLEAKVSIGLLTATVTLPIFEATVIKQLKKAMIRALEEAIVRGTGIGQPLGFTKHTLPADQLAEMAEAEIGKVATWAGVEAKIPETAEDSVIYAMSKATWEKYLNGMTDSSGQKIGLGKINEKGQKILNGREVLTVDKFPSFDAAVAGDIFGVVVDLSQYCLNSNLAMYYKKYFNEDKNKWIHKALMIADGKMAIGEVGTGGSKKLIGAQGLLYLKKKA
ncbi:MAG: phage major capsid protein [Cellulosilyticaceae bacterium]